MDNWSSLLSGRSILNLIGGTARWVYGTLWRTLLQKEKFTFREYIEGRKNTEDLFNQKDHQIVNIVVGFVLIVFIISMLV